MLRIGHRGAAGYAPENTLASFEKAISLKCDMVELDVFLCRSGELVVIHDARLERTTNLSGYVMRKTLAELRQCDAGNGEKIPTLIEVLDLINKKMNVNIELKGPTTLYPVLNIIERYVHEKKWHYDQFLISSFIRSKVKKINQINPRVRVGVLGNKYSPGFLKFAKKINAYSLNVHKYSVNQPLVDAAHSAGLKVFVWTVNETDEINWIKSLGVDGIFSDYPDRV